MFNYKFQNLSNNVNTDHIFYCCFIWNTTVQSKILLLKENEQPNIYYTEQDKSLAWIQTFSYVTAMLVGTFPLSSNLRSWLRCEILGYCSGVGYDTSTVWCYAVSTNN